MRSEKLSIGFTAVFVTIAVTLLLTGTRAVAQETILYNFTGGPTERFPS